MLASSSSSSMERGPPGECPLVEVGELETGAPDEKVGSGGGGAIAAGGGGGGTIAAGGGATGISGSANAVRSSGSAMVCPARRSASCTRLILCTLSSPASRTHHKVVVVHGTAHGDDA